MEQIRIETMTGNIFMGTNCGDLQSQTIKIDAHDKQWIDDISRAVADATGNQKYGASSVGREAVSFYRKFYHSRFKILKYEKAVVAFLDNLP